MGIDIDETKCIGCGLCEIACAYDAIDVQVKARVDNSLCTDCNVCPEYCPTDAIELQERGGRAASLPAEATYDVAVIGSGIGGLCTAALLANQGHRTLVIERNPSLGGRFSSLKHRQLMLPTGGSLIGIGGPLEQVCREVGAPFDVEPFGVSAYWVSGKGWIDPGSGSGQLRRALTQISGDQDAVDAVMAGMKGALVSRAYPAQSLLQWLRTLTDSAELERTFRGIIAAAFGPEDVPAADFFELIAATSGRGMGLARRGLVHLMNGLARSVRERGGDVWTRAEATSVTLNGARAGGLLVERGGQRCRVHARMVVSNAGPRQTLRLAGRERFDRGYVSRVEEQARPVSSISIHLISDRDLLGRIEGAVYTVIGGRRICMIFDATHTAAWAPPGVHITEVYPLTVPDPDVSVDWEAQIEEAALDLDDMSPNWREHAEMKAICLSGEYPGLHAWPGSGVDVETPIPHLLLVGDGCHSRGYAGGAAAAASAQRAATVANAALSRT